MARVSYKKRVWVRQGFVMSWLDPVGAQILSSRLNKRLVKRNQAARKTGEPGLFITLTYRRDEWESPEHLWDHAAYIRHVPRFIARLRKLGCLEPGTVWCCKKEFQQGGWLHYHLLVYGTRYIPPEVAADAWGHGFVSIKRVNRRRLDYTAKYNAKIGEYPEWLLDREVGSVRIFSASHGFWNASELAEGQCPSAGASPLPGAGTGGVRGRLPDAMREDGCSDKLTFRARIRETRDRISVHEEEGGWSVTKGNIRDVILGMYLMGFECVGNKHGGMIYKADHEDVLLAMRAFKDWCARSRDISGLAEYWANEEAEGRTSPAGSASYSERFGGEAAVNLISCQNCEPDGLFHDDGVPF